MKKIMLIATVLAVSAVSVAAPSPPNDTGPIIIEMKKEPLMLKIHPAPAAMENSFLITAVSTAPAFTAVTEEAKNTLTPVPGTAYRSPAGDYSARSVFLFPKKAPPGSGYIMTTIIKRSGNLQYGNFNRSISSVNKRLHKDPGR